ncbi:MAG TPA: hypothetical protein VN380_05995 [Thermoanaerobaculia bacterium]|nr:hypothetical protein [Thermoanaerobaculia bacterium]
MSYRQVALTAAACLIAAALFAEEPECAANYRSDGKSAETFVLTSLTPQAVIERLPSMLIAAGASMQSSEPNKGVLKAEGLDVKAEQSGNATRVTFRLANRTDKSALCRYASLVGNPPAPQVPQDPALIARMKNDLVKKHQIVQPLANGMANDATFASLTDFLELTIKSAKDLPGDKRQYELSMLLPRSACTVAGEDAADITTGFGGQVAAPRTKPVRVEATLVYENLHLTEATISNLESTK